MPKFRQITDIQKLMVNKESIRNLGFLAHIDHGKTTLTDILLAGSGLLSPRVAGSARVLDYLEEEQKRGITMKTANITFLYPTPERSFIINLVDTPGHLDFTGKVTRALRTIDGAVVLVDAVEEIMVQTELVVRQALEERIRPVLFINKVDRLITELKLKEQEIQKKFTRIIDVFNDLIEIYGEPQFKKKWKVNPENGSVVFGSALHRWGFTLDMAWKKNIKFSEIMAGYGNMVHEDLHKSLSLHTAILEMIVKHIPNPLEAQRYRVEKIWKGNTGSKAGKAMADCDDNGPVVACVANVYAESNSGLIATARLFSGTIKSGDKVYLVNAQMERVIKRVFIAMGPFKEPLDRLAAGNLAALSGLETAKAGETIVSSEHKERMVPFERIRYFSEPVVTVAIEPENPKALHELFAAMDQLVTEDPNLAISINQDTGEYILSGIGELHLEFAIKNLRDVLGSIKVAVSLPRVVYREAVTKKGSIAFAKSPNRLNRFTVLVEPLEEKDARLLAQEEFKTTSDENILAVDEYGNVLVDCTRQPEQLREILDFAVSGFTFACRAGPLCGEPMQSVRVNLISLQLSENSDYHNPVEIMHGVGKAVFGSFLTAEPRMLEPVYKTVVSTPAELAGECTRIINGKRGRISAFEQKGALTTITCYIPVKETFGLSDELRSATSGRAFLQYCFDSWEKVPEKLEGRIIAEVRKRKGLPFTVPKAERFLEDNP